MSRIDVYFLKRPAGGSFRIKIDGQLIKTVSTAGSAFEAGFEAVDVPDAPHLLEGVTVGDGRVRLFGATFERRPAPGAYGIVVDSLGVGALNFEQMQHVDSKTRIAMLAHRKYDLVAFILGTNMFAPDLHATWVRNVLADFRAALPTTPILIMSPPDIVLDSADLHSDPRIVRLATQMKAIAADQGAAFWDFREAMGGDASIQTFIRRGLASTDHVHLTPGGGALMGNRVVFALFDGLHRWLDAHPRAGCPGEPAALHALRQAFAGDAGRRSMQCLSCRDLVTRRSRKSRNGAFAARARVVPASEASAFGSNRGRPAARRRSQARQARTSSLPERTTQARNRARTILCSPGNAHAFATEDDPLPGNDGLCERCEDRSRCLCDGRVASPANAFVGDARLVCEDEPAGC